MKKRSSSVAETRRRILDATIKLHGMKGIYGTSWQDIAWEADVSLGTVYKHFPTIDELVPACGELLMARIHPPSLTDVDEIIGSAVEPKERLRKVTSNLFEFYDRGAAHLESDIRERKLPSVQEWERHLRRVVTHFVSEALKGLNPSAAQVQMGSAVLDFPSFRAMQARGMSFDQAVNNASTMITCWLEGSKVGMGHKKTAPAPGQRFPPSKRT